MIKPSYEKGNVQHIHKTITLKAYDCAPINLYYNSNNWQVPHTHQPALLDGTSEDQVLSSSRMKTFCSTVISAYPF